MFGLWGADNAVCRSRQGHPKLWSGYSATAPIQIFCDSRALQPHCISRLHGQIEVYRILLQHKADHNALDGYGQTLLHLASEQGHINFGRLFAPNTVSM